MLINQRIIWSDNGTLKDMSVALNDLTAQTYTLPLVAAEDKIYIGSDLPFNHRHFIVSTANDVASVVTVEFWTGSAWVSAVDVLDQTSVSGVSLAQSGIISWTPERNDSWGIEDSTEDIPQLSTLKIYDMYWARLTFSANLKATTALKYVGHKFAKDGDLAPHGYPDLNLSAIKAMFESGKTDWNEQHVGAAEAVIQYLRQKYLIQSRNQILNWEQFNVAAVHKVAEIIYSSFGPDYEERRALADKKYYQSINLGLTEVDTNQDGKRDPYEAIRSYGLVRT